MKTGENVQRPTSNVQRPIEEEKTPIEVARALYKNSGGDLEKDIREYQWPNGVVVNEPDCFVVAYATRTARGEWAWHVKTAVGELAKLLRLFPVQLPFISFCRTKTGQRMKIYQVERLLATAKRMGIWKPGSQETILEAMG